MNQAHSSETHIEDYTNVVNIWKCLHEILLWIFYGLNLDLIKKKEKKRKTCQPETEILWMDENFPWTNDGSH